MSDKHSAAPRRLRSREWFDDPSNADMTALYLERYMNFGLALDELQSGKPIVGIAQTGSDLSPCNRHHLVLAERIRAGILEAGGIPFEFPVHPIQETGKRPTAGLDRNLAYIGLVEVLFGYPLDGVVLTTGCDKTTPAMLMGAASADVPAILLTGGPMLNGIRGQEQLGSGTDTWRLWAERRAGRLSEEEFCELEACMSRSAGHCMVMGTASTMASMGEALGMAAGVAMGLLTAGLCCVVDIRGRYMASRRKSRSTAGKRFRTRPRARAGQNVRFAWSVMFAGVLCCAWLVVASLKTWRGRCSQRRGGDVTVCSAVLLSVRHVVVLVCLPYSRSGGGPK